MNILTLYESLTEISFYPPLLSREKFPVDIHGMTFAYRPILQLFQVLETQEH